MPESQVSCTLKGQRSQMKSYAGEYSAIIDLRTIIDLRMKQVKKCLMHMAHVCVRAHGFLYSVTRSHLLLSPGTIVFCIETIWMLPKFCTKNSFLTLSC